jgi:FtsH-binding integral membrane protein
MNVPAEMLMKDKRRVVQRTQAMFLTWRDLAGTIVAALAVLVYLANVQDWWYLGSNRWAAVTMLAVGAIGCPLGARVEGEKLSSTPIVLLAVLGLVALVLGVIAIVTAAQWALLALALAVVVLWAGTTLRHAVTPPPRFAAR